MKTKRVIDTLTITGNETHLVETDTGKLAIVVPKWHGTDYDQTTPGTIWPNNWGAAMAWWRSYYADTLSEMHPQRDTESDGEYQAWLRRKAREYSDTLSTKEGYPVMDGAI